MIKIGLQFAPGGLCGPAVSVGGLLFRRGLIELGEFLDGILAFRLQLFDLAFKVLGVVPGSQLFIIGIIRRVALFESFLFTFQAGDLLFGIIDLLG